MRTLCRAGRAQILKESPVSKLCPRRAQISTACARRSLDNRRHAASDSHSASSGPIVRNLRGSIGVDVAVVHTGERHRADGARVVAVDTTVCRPVMPEPQTTASKMSDTHVYGHSAGRSVPLTGCPVTGRCRLPCQLRCQSRRELARLGGPRAHCRFSAFHSETTGSDTMQTDAHDVGREERRAQLERRRAAVAHQLRRLAIELADLDRQLDEIEQSER